MTRLEEIHELLSGMMADIARGDTAQMSRQLAEIARLRGELEEGPPMLSHYLEKRSYAKALEFLEGRDRTVEPGCG